MPVLFPGQALWGVNRGPFSNALSLPTGPEAGPSPGAVVDPSQVSQAPRLQAWKTRLETLHSLPFLGRGPPAPRLATPDGPGLSAELLDREGPKEGAKALHSLGTLPRHQ